VTDPIEPGAWTNAEKLAEEKIELVVARVLRVGVVLSLSVVLIGLVLAFIQDASSVSRGASSIAQHVIGPGFHFPHTFGGVYFGVLHGRGLAIIELGLVLLLITPIARVAIAALLFAVHHDRALATISTVVLVFLMISIILGRSG
jgi:uncharacterized membrane protein